jgi:hypothetical protein
MFLGLVSALYLASAASPQALPGADLAVEVPHLNEASGVFAFLARAGESSAVFQTESWAADFDPLFHSNPTQRSSLETAGIDPEGYAVVSMRGGNHLTCVRALDAKKFQAAADSALKARGTLWDSKVGDVMVHGARQDDHLGLGYAQLGRKVCLVSVDADESGEAVLKEVAAVIHQGSPYQGPLVVNSSKGRWRVSGSKEQLCGEGEPNVSGNRLRTLSAPQTLPPRAPSGMLFVQGSVDPRSLAQQTEPYLRGLCSACPPAPLHALMTFLSQQMTGEVLWRAQGLRPSPQLSDRFGLLRALQFAGGLVLSHPKELTDRLPGLLTAMGGTQDGETWGVPVDGMQLSLSVESGVLWFWSNDAARDVLRHLPTVSRSAERGEFLVAIDGALAAQNLGHLSPIELLRRPELAPLLAVQMELSPLLALGTGRITFGKPSHGRVTGCWKFNSP